MIIHSDSASTSRPAIRTRDGFLTPTITRPTSSSFTVLRTVLLAVCLLPLLTGCGMLGMESGAAKKPATDSPVAVVIEGESFTVEDIDEHMKNAFFEEMMSQPEDQIFEAREKAIRSLVQKKVIDEAAAERDMSAEELFEDITGAVMRPSVEEVTTWYQQNQQAVRGAPLQDVASQIGSFLENERKGEAWRNFIGPKLEALEWEMVLEPPRAELEPTRLVRGDVDAPVTIMAFSDYQCPYCIRSEPVLAEVLERYPGKVRVIHRHFPLDSIHPFARPAAEAAMCADEQGKFWEFHDAIFARQGRLEEGSFVEIGTTLELDLDAFGTCVDDRRYATFVQDDMEAGTAAGVTGTPAFFVNGIVMKGARDADDLSRVVDSELERLGVDS